MIFRTVFIYIQGIFIFVVVYHGFRYIPTPAASTKKSQINCKRERDNNKHNHLDNTLLINSNMSTNKSVTAVKLVLLGEAAVGKSSLVLRFVSNDFQENKGKNAEMIELDQYH